MGPEFFWFGGMWIFPVVGIIVMLFVVNLIFGRGVTRVPWFESTRYSGENSRPDTAMDILKTRYAKGEITKEEYDMMRKNIFN